jgi:hypothetical protein
MESGYPRPPYPAQQQPMPGDTASMDPIPDHGETTTKVRVGLPGSAPDSRRNLQRRTSCLPIRSPATSRARQSP